MKRYYVKERTLARGKKVSMGIDVHKESWQVTATSGEEMIGICFEVQPPRTQEFPNNRVPTWF